MYYINMVSKPSLRSHEFKKCVGTGGNFMVIEFRTACTIISFLLPFS